MALVYRDPIQMSSINVAGDEKIFHRLHNGLVFDCYDLSSGVAQSGVEGNDDALAGQGRSIRNLGTPNIDFNQLGAFCQGVNISYFGVEPQVNIVQILQATQRLQIIDQIGFTGDADQSAAGIPLGKSGDLVVGEGEILQIVECGQGYDIGNGVCGDVQFGQRGASAQRSDIGQRIEGCIEIGHKAQIVDCRKVGQIIVACIQPGQLLQIADGSNGSKGIVGDVQLPQTVQRVQRAQIGNGIVGKVQLLQVGKGGQSRDVADGIVAYIINNVYQKEQDGVVQVVPMMYRVDFSNTAIDAIMERENV